MQSSIHKITAENLPIISRLMLKTALSPTRYYQGTPCWEWEGFTNASGYGTFWFKDSMRLAHRISYKLFIADIAIPGSVKEPTDHLCRNHKCVNPAHLEQVTAQVNALRGIGPTAINAQKTHCSKGHEFTDENTKARGRSRICVTCQKGWRAASRKKNAEKRAAYNREWFLRNPHKKLEYKEKYASKH